MARAFSAKLMKNFPVLIPDRRESGRENGSPGTASTASKPTGNYYPLLLPQDLRNPHKIRLLGEAVFSRENLLALGFGTSQDHSP
jgi:hypothetical protein